MLVSKLDSLRVLEETGVAAASYRTVLRRLQVYAQAGDRGQFQTGEPGAARAAPAAARPVVPVVGDDGVDPVAQQRAQPDQLRPVPQQRPQLAHRRRAIHASGSKPARSS